MAIPHPAKHLCVWLAEPSYLSVSGTDVLTWTDSVSGDVLTTVGTNYPQYDGASVYVDDEDITYAGRVAARVFMKIIPVAPVALGTVFYCGSTFSFRLNSSTTYRSLDTAQNSEDFSNSAGRVWVDNVRTSTFSGPHTVSVENGSTKSFQGFKTHFGTRYPRTKYLAIILTSAVTDAEGEDITNWLMAYPASGNPTGILQNNIQSMRLGL